MCPHRADRPVPCVRRISPMSLAMRTLLFARRTPSAPVARAHRPSNAFDLAKRAANEFSNGATRRQRHLDPPTPPRSAPVGPLPHVDIGPAWSTPRCPRRWDRSPPLVWSGPPASPPRRTSPTAARSAERAPLECVLVRDGRRRTLVGRVGRQNLAPNRLPQPSTHRPAVDREVFRFHWRHAVFSGVLRLSPRMRRLCCYTMCTRSPKPHASPCRSRCHLVHSNV